jgi:hypothetical protein
MKFAPFTLNVKAPEPAVTDAGDTEVTDGTGFEDAGGGVEISLPPPPHAVRKENNRQSKPTIAYKRTDLCMSASESTISKSDGITIQSSFVLFSVQSKASEGRMNS